MKELLRGIGLEDVKARVYTTGHTGILTGESRYVCYYVITNTDSPTCLARTGLMSHERGTPLGMHLEDESERPCWYPLGDLPIFFPFFQSGLLFPYD